MDLLDYQLWGKAPVSPISIHVINTVDNAVPQVSFMIQRPDRGETLLENSPPARRRDYRGDNGTLRDCLFAGSTAPEEKRRRNRRNRNIGCGPGKRGKPSRFSKGGLSQTDMEGGGAYEDQIVRLSRPAAWEHSPGIAVCRQHMARAAVGCIRLYGSACRRCGHRSQQGDSSPHAASYSPTTPIRDSGRASPTEPYAAWL